MLSSVTISAPVLLPILSFGIALYLAFRGGSPVRTRQAAPQGEA